MAALTWATALADRCAYAIFGGAYSSLTTAQKAYLDGGAVANPPTAGVALDAYRTVQRLAQWFEIAGTVTLNTAATDAGEALMMAEVCYRLALAYRKDSIREFGGLRKQALEDYLATVIRSEVTTGYTAGDYSLTLASIRLYVLGNCVRRKERLIVPPEDIDATTHRTLIELWNKASWTFRRRRVTVRVVPIAVTGGTWTEAGKVLSTIDASTYTFQAGDLFFPTSGASVVKEPAEITAGASTSITLNSSIASTLGNLSGADIAGTIVQTRVFGLAATETFDSLATRKLYAADSTFEVGEWSDGDEMSWLMGGTAVSTGKPTRVRIGRKVNTLRWYWHPIPDAAYEFRTECLITPPGTTTPGVPTSASDTTPYATLPREFQGLFKSLVLGRVLLERGITADVWKAATDELERCAPEYVGNGTIDSDRSVRDVYNDLGNQFTGCNAQGGPM